MADVGSLYGRETCEISFWRDFFVLHVGHQRITLHRNTERIYRLVSDFKHIAILLFWLECLCSARICALLAFKGWGNGFVPISIYRGLKRKIWRFARMALKNNRTFLCSCRDVVVVSVLYECVRPPIANGAATIKTDTLIYPFLTRDDCSPSFFGILRRIINVYNATAAKMSRFLLYTGTALPCVYIAHRAENHLLDVFCKNTYITEAIVFSCINSHIYRNYIRSI